MRLRPLAKTFFAIVFSVFLIVTPQKSRAQEGPFMDFLATALEQVDILQLLQGADTWGQTTFDVGGENGIISQVIFSINRRVEQNLRPTGKHDRYLVKDEFTIGFRLGFGLVVSGDVSYARKYTLIYPVETKTKGRFANKFIWNLFLPIKAEINKLPKRYVLKVEDWLEGRGSLRLSMTQAANIGVGVSLNASRIHLSRSFFSRKRNGALNIFFDRQYSNKFTAELYMKLGILGVPIMDGGYEFGSLKRRYISIPENDQFKPKHRTIIFRAMRENDLKSLASLGVTKRINTTFKTAFFNISLLGLMSYERERRQDLITEETIRKDDKGNLYTARVQRFQAYDLRIKEWIFPSTGEKHLRKIVFSAINDNQKEFKEGHMTVRFRTLDNKTKEKEYRQTYYQNMNNLMGEMALAHFPKTLPKKLRHWGKTTIGLEYQLSNKGLNKLLNINQDEYWRAIAEVSGFRRLATASERAKFLKGRWKAKWKHRRFAKRAYRTYKKLLEASLITKTKNKVLKVTEILRAATVKKIQGHEQRILTALTRLLEPEDYHVEAIYLMDEKTAKKGNLPTNRWRVAKGELDARENPLHNFILREMMDVYHLL